MNLDRRGNERGSVPCDCLLRGSCRREEGGDRHYWLIVHLTPVFLQESASSMHNLREVSRKQLKRRVVKAMQWGWIIFLSHGRLTGIWKPDKTEVTCPAK